MEKVYAQHWIDLSKDIREHLSEVFGIVKTGISEIRDQTVISDGTTNNDLQAITAEKMIEYVGSVESFPRLWELTIAKARYELNPPTMELGVGPIEDIPQEVAKEAVVEIQPELSEVTKEESNVKTTTKKSK